MSLNSFNSRSTLKVGDKEYEIYRLDALDQQGIPTKHLPFSLRRVARPSRTLRRAGVGNAGAKDRESRDRRDVPISRKSM
jgi:hypothetical protein